MEIELLHFLKETRDSKAFSMNTVKCFRYNTHLAAKIIVCVTLVCLEVKRLSKPPNINGYFCLSAKQLGSGAAAVLYSATYPPQAVCTC